MIKKLILGIPMLCIQTCVWAQKPAAAIESTLRSNGKIYVVVAVILVIFAGMIACITRLAFRIKKLEKVW